METNNAVSKFNTALLNEALRKSDELSKNSAYNNIELYRFDFDRCEKELVVDENNISTDKLEYYWIEYKIGEQLMKYSFFFKDVDTGSHNVHVIPGLFEEYERQDNFPEEMPYSCVENEKAVIKNVQSNYLDKIESNYPSFAEPCDNGGWWIPTNKYKCISTKDFKIDKKIAIDGFVGYAQEFREFEFTTASAIKEHLAAEYLKKNETPLKIDQSKIRTEKYKPVCYYNIYINKVRFFMDLFNLLYFKNYGFFTQYNCINFTKEEGKNKDIITNYTIVTQNSKNFKAPFSLSDEPKPEEVKEKIDDFLNRKII